MIVAVATLWSGVLMGQEDPSLYLGATLGDTLQHRYPRLSSAPQRRVLLVAGAAAGVAAIFKAPATGVLFALEVSYQDGLARSMLGPALVASGSVPRVRRHPRDDPTAHRHLAAFFAVARPHRTELTTGPGYDTIHWALDRPTAFGASPRQGRGVYWDSIS